MAKILGLDLGTNSIGWALIEKEKSAGHITDVGVRIFPEGVNRDTSGKEVSKNETRRTKRQVRRQIERRKYRKVQLAKFLMSLGMFPKTDNLKKQLNVITLEKELASFFALNPYECRAKGANGDKLTLFELGRVFYHFAQRRGYKESLKEDSTDTGVLYEGSIKDGKTGINETQELIDTYGTLGSGLYNIDPHKTRLRNRYTSRLMYTTEFDTIWEKQKKHYPDLLNENLKHKIGNATEGLLFFQRKLKKQSQLIGNCTLEKNKKRSCDSSIAFELRRTYEFINNIRLDGEPLTLEQRGIILELFFTKEKFEFGEIAKKLKITASRFNYEENKQVAGTKSISGLRKIFTAKLWDSKSLDEQENILNIKRYAEDKEKTIEYLKENERFKFTDKQAAQFIKLRINKGYSSLSYKATKNILPFLEDGFAYYESVWLGGIRNAVGSERWDALTNEKKDYIITNALEIYFNYTEGGENIKHLKGLLIEEFQLKDKELKKLYHHSVDFEKGDGSKNELHEPENLRNPVVMQALFELRKLTNTLIATYGKPDQIRIELSRELKSSIDDRNEMRYKQFENEKENNEIKLELDRYNKPHTSAYIQKLKLFRELEKRAGNAVCPYSGDTIAIHQLWNGQVEVEHIVPYPLSLDDSLANKTLCLKPWNAKKGKRTPFEFYSKEFGKDTWEEIKDRALKLLPYKKWLRFIDEKPKTLEDFESKKLNDNRYISRSAKSYLEHICKDVRVTQGQLTALLRHYWGLDNILNPSVRTPELEEGEYFIAVDENSKLLKAVKWEGERKKDNATYENLSKIGFVLQGNVKKGTFNSYKTRNDHRHHAVDALTIAATETSYLQVISQMKGLGLTEEDWVKRLVSFPQPLPDFFHHAERKLESLIVSHKKRVRKTTKVSKYIVVKDKNKADKKIKVEGVAVRGALHGDSIYGKRNDVFGNQGYHIRKPLQAINKRSQVEKIADTPVKKLIEAAIINTWQKENPELFEKYISEKLITQKGSNWEINQQSKIKYDVPDGAFFEVIKDESGKKIIGVSPKVFLPNKNGNPVPIKKVRMRENSSGAVQLKGDKNQWVEPGNNFAVVIYEKTDGSYDEKIVTFWEAAERKKQGLETFSITGDIKQVLYTLQDNDVFLFGLKEEEIKWNDFPLLSKHLYRLQKKSSKYYVFRKLNAATLDFEKEMLSIRSPKSFIEANPIKVKINVLGKIEKI